MTRIDWPQLHGNGLAGRRVLVTGGAGFIGSHLVEALTQLDATVVVIDDLSGGTWRNLHGLPHVEKIEASILDPDPLARALKACQIVFHLAALGSVPQSMLEPQRYAQVNMHGTLGVLQAARAAGVQRLVFAGSSSAYGDNPVPWRESQSPRPKSPYAMTKLGAESFLQAFALSGWVDTVSLRYFNIFGPRQNANSAYAAVIAAFVTAALAGRAPVIYGDGQQTRDFTYVANAVHANLLAALRPEPLGGRIINVGCGRPITVSALAADVLRLTGRTDLKPQLAPPRPGDLLHSHADLTLAAELLGYHPLVPYETGLEATVAWYRNAK
jgi:nucleoside-diphosphate-sugar epimerase